MAAKRLRPRILNKVWGRRGLPAPFSALSSDADPVGEIWFEHPELAAPALLVKYMFTSEKLSVQVHPDATAAAAAGLDGGKDEAWLIIAAEPDSVIGLGPKRAVSEDELRRGAVDGSIEQLLDWRPVKAGDFYYSPATTIHAIGAGVSLVEVQENIDATYRLFDYGRGRELHLEQGLAVASREPWNRGAAPTGPGSGRSILASGGQFVVERWTGPLSAEARFDPSRPAWVVPIAAGARIDQEPLAPGNVWVVQQPVEIVLEAGADVLVAYPGSAIATTIEIR